MDNIISSMMDLEAGSLAAFQLFHRHMPFARAEYRVHASNITEDAYKAIKEQAMGLANLEFTQNISNRRVRCWNMDRSFSSHLNV